jgi:hypothetical protein
MQLLQCVKQRNDNLVPYVCFAEGSTAQHAAQVALLAILHDDVQLRSLIYSSPERYHTVTFQLLVQLDLLVDLHKEGTREKQDLGTSKHHEHFDQGQLLCSGAAGYVAQ